MVQVLTSQEEESKPPMLAVQWTKVKDSNPDISSDEMLGREKKILLISEVPVQNNTSQITLIRYDHCWVGWRALIEEMGGGVRKPWTF